MVDLEYAVLSWYEIVETFDLTTAEQNALKEALADRYGRLRDERAYYARDVQPVINELRRSELPDDIEPTVQSLFAPLQVVSLANATEIYSLSTDECEWITVYLQGRARELVNGTTGYFVEDIEKALARVR